MLAAAMTNLGGTAAAKGAAAKVGGTLNVVVFPQGSWSLNYNPFSASSLWGTNGMVYEPLLQFIQLTGQTKDWLATSYHWSNGDRELTMDLRAGVNWSNGQPFTSNDVVFTFNLMKRYPALDTGNVWSFLSGVKADGPHTVVFTLKAPDVSGLYYLGSVDPVPASVWSKVKNPVTFVNPHPVATGPFLPSHFSPQEYVLGRNPHYWQKGRPYVAALAFPAYTSNTSVDLALAQGKVDWAALFAPNIQTTYVAPSPATHHYFFPQGAPVVLYLNNKQAPFNQAGVRQALSMAINRSQISKIGEYGYEQPATALGIPPLQQSFVNPAVAQQDKKLSTYNPTAAVALLKKLGFHRNASGTMLMPNGKPFAFTLNVVSGYTDWVEDTQLMAGQLGKIGIKVTVRPLQYAAYYADMQRGTFDASIGWSNSGPTPFYFYNFTMNPNFAAPIGQVASTNFDRFNNVTADKALHAYNTTSSPTVEKTALDAVEAVWLNQLPALPLVWGAYWNEYSTAQFVGWPTAANLYTDPGPNDASAELTVLNLHLK
jgi:peptide/nickel transport system substrate-binding protein